MGIPQLLQALEKGWGKSQVPTKRQISQLFIKLFLTLQSNKKLEKSYRQVSKTVPVHGYYNNTLYSHSIIPLLTTHGLMTKHVLHSLSYATVKARAFSLIHTYQRETYGKHVDMG